MNKYGVKLEDGTSVSCKVGKKKCCYSFYDRENRKITELEGKPPLDITVRHTIGREIFSHIDGFCEKPKESFKKTLKSLKQWSEDWIEHQKKVDTTTARENKEAEKVKIQEALDWYEGFDSPFIWLASTIDWLTAGERANILRTFLSYCSQIILKYPISVIGLGEGSSGKGHISKVARKLCPQEYFINEKKPTLASMFRRSQEDMYYYDGKIVCYGDMGGDNDQDEVRQTKDLLKEMQTDGFINRPVTDKETLEVIDLELYGYPALDFQTVPNYNADDQELSRSIVITPRTDNKRCFFEMKHLLEFEGSAMQLKQKSIEKNLSEMIPNLIRGLRSKFEKISIINPYSRNLEVFIGDTEYYKRDYDKFNALLKVICAFNYSGKKIHIFEGKQYVFVDKYDLKLFFTLFEDMRESIELNLSLKASEILKEFNGDGYADLLEKVDHDIEKEDDDGISVNEYFQYGKVSVSKRSLQRYFSELNNMGYLKIVNKIGKANLYQPTSNEDSDNDWDLDLQKTTVKQLCGAYGETICNTIREDLTPVEEFDAFNQHDLVDKPYWASFDMKGNAS